MKEFRTPRTEKKHDVLTKSDYYKRWLQGEFGNRLRAWQSYADLLASDYTGRVGVRYKEPGSPYCRYAVQIADVPSVISAFVLDGADPAKFTIGEMAPDDCITCQGELQQGLNSYDLFYSTLHGKQMRDALRLEPQWASGARVPRILRHFMDGSSYDDVMELIDSYPDHVIEFSCYDRPVGNCRRNTLIWEVRYY